MLTLPPAHTLGAALSQATAGALGSLLTIVAICAPLLLLWLGCRWLEQRLPTGWPLEHPADPLADGADGAEDVIHTTVPTLRSMRRQTLGSTPASLADATTDATMAPLFPQFPRVELRRRGMVEELIGLNCNPIAVKGTKLRLLRILSQGLRRRAIEIPPEVPAMASPVARL